MEQEAWTRNHGVGIVEKESWRRNHGGCINDSCWRRHGGGTRRHPRHPGLQRPPRERNSSQSRLKCKSSIVFSISQLFFEGRCHFVSIFTRINARRQTSRIPRTLQGPLYKTVRTPLAKASLGNIYVCVYIYIYIYVDIASCLLPIAHCPLPITIAYCLLPIADCLMPLASCLLPIAIAYCPLPIAHCLLPIAYCLLPTAYCLLSCI